MPGPLIAAGYRGVAQMLAGASRGAYRGPGISAEAVAQAVSTTEGLTPGSLVDATRAAVGTSDPTLARGGVLEQIAWALGEVALGEILRRVVDTAQDWFDNRDASETLADDSQDAAEALDDIDAVAETACTEVVLALRAVITQLCTFLASLDPAVHPREFAECVGAGAELIDSAGRMIIDCCRDRDDAVSACLDEFLARGTTLCETPACRAQSEVVDCEPAAGESAAADPVEPAPSAKKPMEVPSAPQSAAADCEEPVKVPEPVKPVEPPEPAPPPKKPMEVTMEVPSAPQSAAADCEEPAKVPEPVKPVEPPEPAPPPKKPMEVPSVPQSAAADPAVPVAPASETEPPAGPSAEPRPEECIEAPEGGDLCGVLGVVGVGVALLGLALLIESLEGCLDMPPFPDESPLPEAEVTTEPETAAPPVDLAEVPEPPPPPKQAPAPAPVPDPTPPPAAAAPSQPTPPPSAAAPSQPTPPPAPTPPPPTPTTETPPPAPVPGSARKAGAW